MDGSNLGSHDTPMANTMDYCVPQDHNPDKFPAYSTMRQDSIPTPFYTPLKNPAMAGATSYMVPQNVDKKPDNTPPYTTMRQDSVPKPFYTPLQETKNETSVIEDMPGTEGKEKHQENRDHNVYVKDTGTIDRDLPSVMDTQGTPGELKPNGERNEQMTSSADDQSSLSAVGMEDVTVHTLDPGQSGVGTDPDGGNRGGYCVIQDVVGESDSSEQYNTEYMEIHPTLRGVRGNEQGSKLTDSPQTRHNISLPGEGRMHLEDDMDATAYAKLKSLTQDPNSVHDELLKEHRKHTCPRRLMPNHYKGKKRIICWIIIGVILALLMCIAIVLSLILTKKGDEVLSDTGSIVPTQTPSTLIPVTNSNTTVQYEMTLKDQQILQLMPTLFIPLTMDSFGRFPTSNELINLDVVDQFGDLHETSDRWTDGIELLNISGPVYLYYLQGPGNEDILDPCVLKPALCLNGWALSFVIQSCTFVGSSNGDHTFISVHSDDKENLLDVGLYQEAAETGIKIITRLSADRMVKVVPLPGPDDLCKYWLHVMITLSYELQQDNTVLRVLRVYHNGTEPEWGNSYSSKIPANASQIFEDVPATLQLGIKDWTDDLASNRGLRTLALDDVIFFNEYKDKEFVKSLYADVYVRHLLRQSDVV